MLRAATLLALSLFAATPAAAASGPFVIEEFFSRPAVATGTFKNALDGSVRGIKVRFRGQWDRKAQTLTLAEDIAYSDGQKERKVWRLTKTGPGTYVGTRDDIIGKAIGTTDAEGRLHLRYRATVGSRTLHFDDTLALQPDGTVLNTAEVSYLVFHVGDVELRFRRSPR
jgi:hypothetical protein